MDPDLKKRVERSIVPVPGPWKSGGSEKEIADAESAVPTPNKVTWTLSSERLQRKPKFDHSNSKSNVKNAYVGLEPRSNETYECTSLLLNDAVVQTTGKMVNAGVQTDTLLEDKCIQSVAIEEEMFQLQHPPKLNTLLGIFLEKHTPNLMDQLESNMLYDLYRDDFKELKNINKFPLINTSKEIKSFHSYVTAASKNQSVSCHTWHPTIPGVFAISYMANSNKIIKTVDLNSAKKVIDPSIEYLRFSCKNIFANCKNIEVIENREGTMMKRVNTPQQLTDEYFVSIWSINDNAFPKLTLSSPDEVCCVKFNPRHGNTVVGGLMNGQICLWDISGKLESNDIDPNDLIKSKYEKELQPNLYVQMQRLLTNIESVATKIRATALSNVFESHISMVTEIQWVHPMHEITPLGKLMALEEDHFSSQFFSSSSDGTIKLWDLHSTPVQEPSKPGEKDHLQYPVQLESYVSPLTIYDSRLKPSYTMIIKHPSTEACSPITAMSYEVPLQYKYTSDKPLVIGKRQFEYVPRAPSDPNERRIVVGNIFGEVGVVTWNGYENRKADGNKEKCKNIWWGHAEHHAPITCILKNVFYRDLHLVCGGNVLSIWSENYENGPIWTKIFKETPNSVVWSNHHPAEFRVSLNTSGVLEFWNFVKDTKRPYYELNSIYTANDKFKGTLSTPYPSIHHINEEQLQYSQGISEILNFKKNETIAFSDSNGVISLITVTTVELNTNEINEACNLIKKRIDYRHKLRTNSKNLQGFTEEIKKNKKQISDYEAKKQEKMDKLKEDIHRYVTVEYEADKERLKLWMKNNPVP